MSTFICSRKVSNRIKLLDSDSKIATENKIQRKEKKRKIIEQQRVEKDERDEEEEEECERMK